MESFPDLMLIAKNYIEVITRSRNRSKKKEHTLVIGN